MNKTMKVLLFTHEQDIDGMGSIILSLQTFKNLKYVPCKTFEITKKVQEYVDNKEIYNYDRIFVTDLCIKEPLLSKINDDEVLRNKIIVLDHHKSEIVEGNDKYDFVNIIVENEKGKTSGTSLFYDYLISQGLLIPTPCLDELVEMTRQYDTWEWAKIYNNIKARSLHLLFEQVGYKKYIEKVCNIISTKDTFEFNENDLKIIENFDIKLKEDVPLILNNMKIKTLVIDNVPYKIGFVISPYKYRNDLSEIIKENNIYDIDLVGIIMTDTDTVSYRCVKDVDASKVGVYFGGKGHKGAASNLKSNEKFLDILNMFN